LSFIQTEYFNLLRETMNKPQIMTAMIALGAFAAVAFIQRSVIQIPVIGAYLPGGVVATPVAASV
jgi:hypothetical protein